MLRYFCQDENNFNETHWPVCLSKETTVSGLKLANQASVFGRPFDLSVSPSSYHFAVLDHVSSWNSQYSIYQTASHYRRRSSPRLATDPTRDGGKGGTLESLSQGWESSRHLIGQHPKSQKSHVVTTTLILAPPPFARLRPFVQSQLFSSPQSATL